MTLDSAPGTSSPLVQHPAGRPARDLTPGSFDAGGAALRPAALDTPEWAFWVYRMRLTGFLVSFALAFAFAVGALLYPPAWLPLSAAILVVPLAWLSVVLSSAVQAAYEALDEDHVEGATVWG
jgi:hypothetical protein